MPVFRDEACNVNEGLACFSTFGSVPGSGDLGRIRRGSWWPVAALMITQASMTMGYCSLSGAPVAPNAMMDHPHPKGRPVPPR